MYVLPLTFVRSGAVNLNGGMVWVLGQYGSYWSRTAYSSTNAYYRDFYPPGVTPSRSYNRWAGFPLRCLYPGSA